MSFNPGKKTQKLYFYSSNAGKIDNQMFSFNAKIIPLSASHKDLGVISPPPPKNAKWNEHLENIKTKQLGILRKLKFSL